MIRHGMGGRDQPTTRPVESFATVVRTDDGYAVRTYTRLEVPNGTPDALLLAMADMQVERLRLAVRDALRDCGGAPTDPGAPGAPGVRGPETEKNTESV